MQREGEQIERREQVGEAVAAVPEVALAVAPMQPGLGVDELVVQQFVQTLVRVGFRDEDEIGLGVEDGAADRLAAVQVVAQEDRAAGAQLLAMVGEPALGGVAFAVLLAALRGEFRPRLAAASCFGGTNSPIIGSRRLWPSATTLAESIVWKYCSVLPAPTWRVAHCRQRIESEQ